MSKNGKILLSLLALAVLLIVFLALRSKPLAQTPPQNEGAVEKVDLEQLEKNYKKEVKIILADYSALIKEGEPAKEAIISIKEKLLGLKVPAEFKDLHLNLVLAVAKMAESANEANANGKEAGAKLIQDLKAKYVWLN